MNNKILLFICSLFLWSYSLKASDKKLDGFTKDGNYYIAANPSSGSGTISKSISTTQFKEGYSSLQIDYSLIAASGNYVEVFRSYSTSTLDLSFMPDYLSIWVKGQTGNSDVFKFMLYEDHDMDGNPFETGDETYVYTNNTVLNTNGWTLVTMPYASFVKFGGGTGTIDLNRIGAWRILIENGNGTAHSGSVYIDDLRQHTTYNPTAVGTPKLTGSFIQLWNNAGCNCGQWTQTQWDEQLQKMKEVCMDKLVIQYSVYGGNAWYTPSSLSYITYKNQTLDKIFQAANANGIKVYLGLYFDETWNTFDKSVASNYSNLLQKQKEVIDELYNLFGTNDALGGWYIPQEINDLEWQTTTNRNLLASYLRDVAAYAKSRDASKKVMIAPFFGPHRPADDLQNWYEAVLSIAAGVDVIYPQDGVGTTTKDVDVDIPHYFKAIKNACDAKGRTFGATVESFLQTDGEPINTNTFASVPAPIANFKTQLQESGKFTADLITFEWGYMQPGLTTATQELYDDYKTYANCTTTSIIDKDDAKTSIVSYPVPAVAGFSITVKAKGFSGAGAITVINTVGKEIYAVDFMNSEHIEFNLPKNIAPGTYVLMIKNENRIRTKRIVVQ